MLGSRVRSQPPQLVPGESNTREKKVFEIKLSISVMTGRSAWACVALILVVFEASLVLGEGEVGGSRPVREKRAPFSSWAGKRSSEEDLSSAEMAQVPFSTTLAFTYGATALSIMTLSRTTTSTMALKILTISTMTAELQQCPA
jgi:hypothetical protein